MGSPASQSDASAFSESGSPSSQISASPGSSTAPLTHATGGGVPAGTPRPGGDYVPPTVGSGSADVDPTAAASAGVQYGTVGPGTPRVLEGNSATAQDAKSMAYGSNDDVLPPRPQPSAAATSAAASSSSGASSASAEAAAASSQLAAQQTVAASIAAAEEATPTPTTPASPTAGATASLNEITLMDDSGLDGGGGGGAPEEGAEDEDWTAEEELPAKLTSLVDAHIATARAELTKGTQLEAAKWLLGKKLLPPNEKKPELAAAIGAFLSMKKEELAAGHPKPPEFGSELSEDEQQECLSTWRQRMSSMLVQMRSPASCKDAQEAAEPWCAAFMDAKREVIDPNERRLTEHLEGMWTEQVGAAKKELEGSRLRDVMRAHARTINGSLKAAMDDVESQFCEGMRPIVAARLSSSGNGAPAPLDTQQLTTLILSGIRAFRVGFDKPWEIKTLEKQLTACMALDQAEKDAAQQALDAQIAAARPQPNLKASTDMETDPVGFLLGLVLGSVELPLETPVREWLATACADYLDPFIDGEVPPAHYHTRSEGWFMQRLRSRWASRPNADSTPFPVPPQFVLAQYVSHCICKMNTQLGFGQHTPGLGRQPASDHEAARLHDQVGRAIVEAVQRDFEEADRAFGSLKGGLRAENIVHVSRIHLNGLIAYQNELGTALAIANRDGEEARREERMKIWGYA